MKEVPVITGLDHGTNNIGKKRGREDNFRKETSSGWLICFLHSLSEIHSINKVIIIVIILTI